MEDFLWWLVIILVVVFAFSVGSCKDRVDDIKRREAEAIERGFATYRVDERGRIVFLWKDDKPVEK